MKITEEDKLQFENLSKKINKFFYSNYYILLLVLVPFIFWVSDISVTAMSLLLIIGLVCFIFNKDATPTLVLLPLMVMSVSSNKFLDDISGIIVIVIFGVLLAIGLVFNLVHYKQKIKIGKLTIPLMVISVALLLGGIGSPFIKDYARGLDYIFYLGPLMLVLYTFAISCMDIPSDVDAKRYLAKLILPITIMSCLQVIVAHLRLGLSLVDHFRNELIVGWSNRAGLVLLLVLTLSIVFYLAETAKNHNFIWYNCGFLTYCCLMITGGRGGMIFGTIEMIVLAIFLLIKSKHRKQFLYALACWILLGIIALGVFWNDFVALLEKFKDIGFSTSGRMDLYHEAWQLFIRYPLFGVGIGYEGTRFPVHSGCMYWFHSTPLQIIASMGIFGLCCFTYLYIVKFKVLLKNKDLFNIMVTIAIVAFELQNLIDSVTFSPFPFLYLSFLLNTFVEYTNNNQVMLNELK